MKRNDGGKYQLPGGRSYTSQGDYNISCRISNKVSSQNLAINVSAQKFLIYISWSFDSPNLVVSSSVTFQKKVI